MVCSRKSWGMTKPGWCLGVRSGNLPLIRATEIQIGFSCQDFNGRQRKRLSSCLHFFHPSPALRQCFSQESCTGPWVYSHGKPFAAPKPIAPFRDQPTTEKSQRSHSGCADLFHKQLLQPIVWLSSTKGYPLGIFSSDGHTLQWRGSPCLPGEAAGKSRPHPSTALFKGARCLCSPAQPT